MSGRDMMPGDKGKEDKDRKVKGENFLDIIVSNCARRLCLLSCCYTSPCGLWHRSCTANGLCLSWNIKSLS